MIRIDGTDHEADHAVIELIHELRVERDSYREALIEANEETKLYPGHEGRWGKLLGDA